MLKQKQTPPGPRSAKLASAFSNQLWQGPPSALPAGVIVTKGYTAAVVETGRGGARLSHPPALSAYACGASLLTHTRGWLDKEEKRIERRRKNVNMSQFDGKGKGGGRERNTLAYWAVRERGER